MACVDNSGCTYILSPRLCDCLLLAILNLLLLATAAGFVLIYVSLPPRSFEYYRSWMLMTSLDGRALPQKEVSENVRRRRIVSQSLPKISCS